MRSVRLKLVHAASSFAIVMAQDHSTVLCLDAYLTSCVAQPMCHFKTTCGRLQLLVDKG